MKASLLDALRKEYEDGKISEKTYTGFLNAGTDSGEAQGIPRRTVGNGVGGQSESERVGTTSSNTGTRRGTDSGTRRSTDSGKDKGYAATVKNTSLRVNPEEGKGIFDAITAGMRGSFNDRRVAGDKPLGGVKEDRRVAAAMRRRAATPEPLSGLPRSVKVDGTTVSVGPFGKARDAADKYIRSAGLKETPPTDYVRVDPVLAKRIAQAYEDMKDDPQDPEVKTAYAALVRETLAQWKAVKDTGLKVEFFPIREGHLRQPTQRDT